MRQKIAEDFISYAAILASCSAGDISLRQQSRASQPVPVFVIPRIHYFYALRLVTNYRLLALESGIQSDIIRGHYFCKSTQAALCPDHAPPRFSSSSGINLKRKALALYFVQVP